MKAPAFTPVAARRSLETQDSSPPQKQIVWPQSVRDYVQRSFDLRYQKQGVNRDDIAGRLKAIISSYAETDTMDQVDWKNMPLPHQLILEERAKATAKMSNGTASLYITVPGRGHATATTGKRSLADADLDNPASPPWRKTNRTSRDDRPNSHSPSTDEQNAKGNSKFSHSLENRRLRFQGSPITPNVGRQASPVDLKGPIVGTCEDLEKRYLRLTSAPDPSLVRPQVVLEKTLELLKKKLKKEVDYDYICDQFKSMRQDLMVQHVTNEFTVTVYEIHARVALEKGDLGEYNQCQTQLRSLYKQGVKGHPEEFLAYRILYAVHTSNKTDMSNLLARLTAEERESVPVKHALQVRSAVANGNYHLLFQLYLDTPNMGGYIVEMFATRERLSALCRITRSYKGKVKLRFMTEELGFESDQECARFLVDYVAASCFSQEKGEPPMFIVDMSVFRIFDAAREAAFLKVDVKGQIK